MSLTASQFGEFLFGTDILPKNIFDVTEDRFNNAIALFTAAEQAFVSKLTSLFCDVGTDVQTGFFTNVGGVMQEMSDIGGVEASHHGTRWYTAYPIKAYATEQIYGVSWLERATVADLAVSMHGAMLSDIRTTINALLSSILNNVNGSHDESKWPGMNAGFPNKAQAALTISRLANADSAAGSVYARGIETQLASLNHYLTSGGASPAYADFTTMRDKLGVVGNDVDIKVAASRTTCNYVADNFTAAQFAKPVQLRTDFMDQDIFARYGKQSEGLLDPGIRSRGYVADKMELLEFPHMPDNYYFAWDASKEPPVRNRISDLPNYQGLHLATPNNIPPDPKTHPLVNRQWRRIQGFGVRNRANGVVMKVTSGSYDVPTIA